MYNDKKIIAIIPARKGSKGLPDKNIKLLNNKPLIAYSIEAAIKSQYIDKVLVSTDSEDIKNISIKHRAICNNLRPDILSTDEAKIYDVLKYELHAYKNFNLCVLLQPTSPLRTTEIIDNAIREFMLHKYTSAVAVHNIDINPYLIRTIENNKVVSLLKKQSTIRRQDIPKYYKVNGMIYINHVKDILSSYMSLNDNEYPLIVPAEISIDIDDLDDFKKCEKILYNKNSNIPL